MISYRQFQKRVLIFDRVPSEFNERLYFQSYLFVVLEHKLYMYKFSLFIKTYFAVPSWNFQHYLTGYLIKKCKIKIPSLYFFVKGYALHKGTRLFFNLFFRSVDTPLGEVSQ